jgi:hypothetical protein
MRTYRLRAKHLRGGGEGIVFVALVFLASRALYFTSGAVFARLLPASPGPADTRPLHHLVPDIWARWDGIWYAYIAAHGYERGVPAESAFFPLPSLLSRLAADALGVPPTLEKLGVVATVLSTAFTLLGFYFVYRIADEECGKRVARNALLGLAFFPTSFFFNAAYSEGLFLMLSAGAVWAAKVRRNLLLACILAGLASATREAGVFLIIPLAYGWLANRERYGWRSVYLALVPSGALGYMAYLWYRYGNPMEFKVAEARHWGRRFSGPVTTLSEAVRRARQGERWALSPDMKGLLYGRYSLIHSFLASNAYYLIFFVLALVLLVVGLRLLPWDLLLYSAALVLLPAFYGVPFMPLMSFSRFMLVAFPLFIVLGYLLKSRLLLAIWLAASGSLSLLFCALFVSWRWVA